MAVDLTEGTTFAPVVTVPQPGDDRKSASVDLPFQQLTDRTRFLVNRVASQVIHTTSSIGNTIPDDTIEIEVEIVGGGGGGSGGAGPGNNDGSCGGGSGRIYRTRIPRAQVGSTYDVTIGAGGAGGAGGVTGATGANVGSVGALSSVSFIGPGDVSTHRTIVQAAGGQGGQLLAGGFGYNGGGGASPDALGGGGAGGSLGGAGQDGSGGTGRLGGLGESGVSFLGVHTGASCLAGAGGVSTGVSLQAGGGGGAGPLGTDGVFGVANDGSPGTGSHTNGGGGGIGFGAGGGGGGQGVTASGAGGTGADGLVTVTFIRGLP